MLFLLECCQGIWCQISPLRGILPPPSLVLLQEAEAEGGAQQALHTPMCRVRLQLRKVVPVPLPTEPWFLVVQVGPGVTSGVNRAAFGVCRAHVARSYHDICVYVSGIRALLGTRPCVHMLPAAACITTKHARNSNHRSQLFVCPAPPL